MGVAKGNPGGIFGYKVGGKTVHGIGGWCCRVRY